MGANLGWAFDQEPDGKLSDIRSLVSCSAGKTVLFQGDSTKHFFEIIRGVVKQYKLLPDGRRQVTGFLYPGSYFGPTSGEGVACTAEALTEVKLWRYCRAGLEGLTEQMPDAWRVLLELMSSELRKAEDHMLLLGRMTAHEKIAVFLMTLAQQASAQMGPARQVYLPMKRPDIADYLGLTAETVSRSINQLKRQGIIKLCGSETIMILDPDRLGQIAEGEEDSRLAEYAA